MEPLVNAEKRSDERETWRGKFEFVLSLIGFSVGYGNVWRFPYLCYKNGGGCFLFPYVIFIALAALPMLILEVGLGQFMQSGAITAWNVIPLFQGVGYAATVLGHWQNVCYACILAWNLYFLFASFTSVLPWSNCNNSWNTDQCNLLPRNSSVSGNDTNTTEPSVQEASASQEFWNHKVLQISDGLEEPGTVKWDLVLCLLLAWILCYICVWRGTRSTRKIVYFTATFPYVIMMVLILRAVTLDGAREGLLYFINLDWNKLKTGQVWLDAGMQVLFTYSVGTGTMTALGSYNNFHWNMYRDCIIFAVVNSLTSVLSGILIFALLGFLAKEEGVALATAAESGPGLVFVAIPAAVAKMSYAPAWSFLFFLMLLFVGIDSEFVAIQGFVTAIVDRWPDFFRRRNRKEVFTAIICIFWFIIGLSMMTKAGAYARLLLAIFSSGGATMFVVVFFESIAVAWFYGAEDFYKYIIAMNGYRIFSWIKFCWKYAIPAFCVVIFTMNMISEEHLTYDETYEFPKWSLAIGWLISGSIVCCIPMVALIKIIKGEGTVLERWDQLISRNNPVHIPDSPQRRKGPRKRLVSSESQRAEEKGTRV